jgi:hypothetical protein
MQTISRTMTAKSRLSARPLIVPPLRVGMHPETLRVSPLTFPNLLKHIPVGAGEACDLLIFRPANLWEISCKVRGCP